MAHTRIHYPLDGVSEYVVVEGELDAVADQVNAARRGARLLKLKSPDFDPIGFWYLNPDMIISLIDMADWNPDAATVIS
jgi:hypothetical protein